MTDVVDQELDRLISRRASTDRTPTEDDRNALWRSSLRAHKARLEDEHHALWCSYHMAQARRLRANLERLIAHHEERARKLQRGSAA